MAAPGGSGNPFVALPDPGRARTVDDLVEALRAVRAWAGDPSYETIKNRVNAAWTAAGRPVSELTKKTTVVDCFRTGRRRLNTELVIAVVAALHHDGGYTAQWRQALRVVGGETQAAEQVRAQDTLPDDLAEFTGRGAVLDQLRRIRHLGAESGDAVVISAIEGMAGVGKTRLAVHAGHLLAREDPFEQVLFVNLRGFHPEPAQPPADPTAVLDSFLRLLGVPGQQIPHGLDTRAKLYRRRLAGRRALVVLDNAADEEQVRPLLPGSPGCLTLVTSRRSLTGLHPATHLAVDGFTSEEALDFLARAAPGTPVGDDPRAAARVVRRCGHLPLALAVVAGHMRARPDWTLTDHADRLDERHGSHTLDDGVDLALSLSYQHLPPDRQRLLRLLALHPGHDLDAYAAAALTGLTVDAAREHLHLLVAEHLLLQSAPGRFGFHDLVRAYAADRASDEDRPPERRAALTRLFDHYLHTTAAAMHAVWPAERHLRPRVPPPATPIQPVEDPAAARGWLDTERVNLLAVIDHTAGHGWPTHTVRLATTLFRYLDNRGHYRDAIAVHSHARQAAYDSGDRAAEAETLVNLGASYWGQGRFVPASDHSQQALTLYRQIGDRHGEARALINLGIVHRRSGRYPQAADYAQRALELFRKTGDRLGEARALTNVSIVHWRWGRYAEAANHHRQALTLYRELGDRAGQANSLTNLGLAHERLGEYPQAADCTRRALALYREIGERNGQANALTNLGVVYQRMSRHRRAADHHRQALTLFRELGDPAGQAEALNGLGEAMLTGGQPDQARTHHSAALTVAADTGDRQEQARAHNGLAHTHHATGEANQARHHWQQALAIYTDLGVPEADQVRGHLTDQQVSPGCGGAQARRGAGRG